MDSKGNDALLKTTKVTEWNIEYGGYVAVAFGGCLMLGCAVAYVIAVLRGNVDPILPLISDAAGSPPQNGLFGTLLCLGGMFGVVFMLQRYMIVQEKNHKKSSLITFINKLALVLGIVSMLGITLITGYPVNFYRNRDVWLNDVGLPHMIGGVILFAFGLVYIALQCILTLFQKDKKESHFSLRVLLLMICTAAFVYHMITVPDHFNSISPLYYANSSVSGINYTGILPFPPTLGMDLKLPIDTGGTYVASAIAEWVFVFFFCCFFFTFFTEAQKYSLVIIIETQNKNELDESKLDFKKLSMSYSNNGSQVPAKPPPELRKVLRCDSTCQTMDMDKILKSSLLLNEEPAKKKNPPKDAPTKSTLSSTEVDAKLTHLLNETKSETSPVIKNGHDKKELSEKEAIEQIDVVVKEAESNADAKNNETEGTVPSACPLSVQ